MKYKKSIIVIMLAIFIFSIAAVSASDVNDTAIASEDTGQMELSAGDEITEENIQTNENILTQTSTDETVSASNEQDVLGGTYADLHYEINNGGTTVELQRDYYAYDGTPVSIGITDDNRIIDGKGAVIDMAGAPSSIRIFDIDASRVTIKNLTIINVNFIDCGGAILFNPGSSGTVENCNFINNTASDGSAICFVSSTGTVRNCNFTNNSCESYGGAIAFSNFGSTGTVTDCNFAYNSAKYGGAIAFAYDSTGTVTNCNFTNNNTADYGGAVYFSSSGNVTNCNFVNGSSYYGGAVFWIGNDGRISDCNFTGNTAVRRGGAVHWGDTETESESQSDYTKAKNGIITRSNFINNTAAQGGAVFWFANDGKITDNCYFKDNNATGEGGAVYWKGKNGYISNKCTFTDNEAIIYAGAIYWQGDDGTLTDNCRFIKNSAYTQGADGIYRGGGAIFWMGRNANVSDNCSFINNTAYTSEGSGFLDSYRGGGAIYIPGAESHVTDCIFTGNFATHYGGAVYAVGGNSVVDRCSFENNSANMGGAAFTAASDYSYISNCVFVNNYGIDFSSNGGAVNFKNYENSLSNCTFKDNYAENCGGAVYWQRDGGDVFNCSFENNSAYTSGGALYMEYGGTISYCDFVNNHGTGWASTAGAIYIYSASSIKNCNFTNNTAIKNGGAVFFQNKGELTDCNFKDNKASNDGGAVYFNSNGNVTNCNFTNNSATQNGGAVYFNKNVEGNVTDCSFINNSATKNGGAIYFDEGSNGRTINCNFTGNSARNGGAVYFYGYGGNVSNCNFTNNSATVDGGAVYISSNGIVTNCNFTGNTATRYGGAISRSSGTVSNCNFTNNSAGSGGAINTGSGSVSNCNFADNTVTYYGGAVFFDANGEVTNCNFTGNNATNGSAIYFGKLDSSDTLTVSDSTFLNNRANAGALDIVKTENNITITFTGQNNLLNAIYSIEDAEVAFTNVTYWGAKGITTVSATMSGSNKAAGQKITVGVVVNDKLVLNDVIITNETGTIVLNISAGENYYISARHNTDSYYTEAERTISNNTKFSVNVTSKTTNNKTVNITAESNIPNDVVQGKLLFIVPTGANITANYAGNGTWWAVYEFADYGDYQVNATYIGLDNVTVNNATISISKTPTNITVEITSLDLITGDETVIVANLTPADAGNITFTSSNEDVVYVDAKGNVIAQGKGQAIITLSFAENNDYAAAENRTITVTVSPADASVTVDKNTLDLKIGEKYAINAAKHPDTILLDITYTSSNSLVATVDENGIVTAVGEGTAVITVEVGDDDFYAKNSTNVTVTVRKVPTEIGAKAITATYNVNKNLVITLKDSNGKALSGLKITVDLNGAKTYTTDKNGQIKVKTKGLAPKKYTAKITFKGNAIYAKSTKNVKVTVKKAKTKITSKKKVTFKAGKKVKKLKITLKDNKGKPIKNVKVRLMLKKIGKNAKKNTKTKTKANKKIAKTNKKGKATFKIKKNKKAKYLAYVKFYANKYYKKTVKKIKITIR